jgi:hypothetical protein
VTVPLNQKPFEEIFVAVMTGQSLQQFADLHESAGAHVKAMNALQMTGAGRFFVCRLSAIHVMQIWGRLE